MKEKFIRFMQGRYGAYGPDLMNRCLMFGALAAMIVSIFSGWDFLYYVALAALAYAYFRMFSRNHSKRYGENQLFMSKTSGIRKAINQKKSEWKQSKTHHIYKCPSCKQKIRVPRGKGKIAVGCPKCKAEFIKNS